MRKLALYRQTLKGSLEHCLVGLGFCCSEKPVQEMGQCSVELHTCAGEADMLQVPN